MLSQLRASLVLLVLMTLLTGVLYPLVITGLAQWWWPDAAHGSLISRDGVVIGSRLIAQAFARRATFIREPRRRAPDTMRGEQRQQPWADQPGPDRRGQRTRRRCDEGQPGSGAGRPRDRFGKRIGPAPLASGGRLASATRCRGTRRVRGCDSSARRSSTEGRLLGFLGEPRVNVLQLNLALDDEHPQPAR